MTLKVSCPCALAQQGDRNRKSIASTPMYENSEGICAEIGKIVDVRLPQSSQLLAR